MGLGCIVLDGDERGLLCGVPIRPEVLGEPFLGERDHRVGRGQDRHGGAVITVQGDDRGGGIELVREVEDVADSGGAEAIDRLGIVANDGQAFAIGLQGQKDRRLDRIGVLIFIHQHMIEEGAHLAGKLRHFHELGPIEEEIVVIEHMLALLGLDIGFEQAAKIVLKRRAPGKMPLKHQAERLPEFTARE